MGRDPVSWHRRAKKRPAKPRGKDSRSLLAPSRLVDVPWNEQKGTFVPTLANCIDTAWSTTEAGWPDTRRNVFYRMHKTCARRGKISRLSFMLGLPPRKSRNSAMKKDANSETCVEPESPAQFVSYMLGDKVGDPGM